MDFPLHQDCFSSVSRAVPLSVGDCMIVLATKDW
jgi:hypothetical protein